MFASARRLAAMQGLKGVPGVELVPLDLNSSASIREAVAQVVSRAGHIDILVSKALTLSVTSGRPSAEAAACPECDVPTPPACPLCPLAKTVVTPCFDPML